MSKVSKAYHQYVEPVFEKFKSSASAAEAFDVAKEIIPQVAFESLQHPDWTDDDRRALVVKRVKAALSSRYPGAGWFISMAIDFAVDHLRSQKSG